MKLTVYNGSPRAKKSKTDILLGHFIQGFMENNGNTCETRYIIQLRGKSQLRDIFQKSENAIIAFPLYLDSMPGTVKEFIEELVPLFGQMQNTNLGFLVQNGFPETHHNRFIQRYLEKFTQRLGCKYSGTIAKGGCEGLDIQPDFLVQKIFDLFKEIGRDYGMNGTLDENLLKKLARPEHLTEENIKFVVPFVNENLWDAGLKANNAFEKSFARPYIP